MTEPFGLPRMSFGRFDQSGGLPPMSTINITPLVDVMLVLVVVLIVTAPLLVSAVKLHLPQADAAPSANALASVTVVIDAAGQTYWGDHPVTLAVLAQQLHRTAQANPHAEVQLHADQTVSYGRMVQVIHAAQQAGLSHIGLATDASTSKQPPLPHSP